MNCSFTFLDVVGDDTFCKGKQDGYYLDPKDCAAFYQCSRGSAFRKHCLRGQVFNDILKTCDSPMNFPCRQRSLISVLGPSKERTVQPVVNPITQHDQPELSQSTLQKGIPPNLSCCSWCILSSKIIAN